MEGLENKKMKEKRRRGVTLLETFLFSGNGGEFNSLNTSTGVKGRLSVAVNFWNSTSYHS